MTRLTFAFLSIWASLILATAGKTSVSRMHGEWLKVAARIAQQPPPIDVAQMLASIDPEGRWLSTVMTVTA